MNERIKNLVKQTARELVYEHDDEIEGVMDVWKFQNKDIEVGKMTIKTQADFIRIQQEVRRDMEQLAKIYPHAFDKNGKPIVATLTFPKVK